MRATRLADAKVLQRAIPDRHAPQRKDLNSDHNFFGKSSLEIIQPSTMQRKRQAAQDKGSGNQGDVQKEKKLCFSKILPRSKIYDTAFVITANLAFVYYCLCWSRSLAQIYCTSVQYWRAWEATLSGDRIRRRLLYCSKASTHRKHTNNKTSSSPPFVPIQGLRAPTFHLKRRGCEWPGAQWPRRAHRGPQ
jgi:hypothetical protein